MLNPKQINVIPDPSKLSVADVFELLQLRKAPKQPGVYELWIGPGKNHPAKIFRQGGDWVAWTILYRSKDSVLEYLVDNPESFNQLKKDFPYAITEDLDGTSS